MDYEKLASGTRRGTKGHREVRSSAVHAASQEVIGIEGAVVETFSSLRPPKKLFTLSFGSVSAIIIIAQLTITSNYVRVSFSHIYFVKINFKFFFPLISLLMLF